MCRSVCNRLRHIVINLKRLFVGDRFREFVFSTNRSSSVWGISLLLWLRARLLGDMLYKRSYQGRPLSFGKLQGVVVFSGLAWR